MDSLTSMMRGKLCGEMGRSPIQLSMDWGRGSGQVRFPQAPETTAVFTHSGRAAIRLAAHVWGLGNGDEVLVPAYNCGSEISPLVAAGAQVAMYRVDGDARIDVEDISRRLTARTRLVYITHYFGRSVATPELIALCRQHEVKLLEDCALALFSDGVGSLGDAAIFSLRKSLPATDGGVLLMRQLSDDAPATLRGWNPGLSARGGLSLMKKWSQQWLGFASAGNSEHERPQSMATDVGSFPDIPASYYWPANSSIYRASPMARGVLKRSDPEKVRTARRENYQHLHRRLVGLPGVRLLWPEDALADGVCPLGLPIVVADKPQWCQRLNAAGIAVAPWWTGYHRGFNWEAFPEARELKDHLLLLPVHQQLNAAHMQYIAAMVQAVAGS
jgi:perosamine synthetase